MLKSYLPLAHSSDQPPLFLVYITVVILSEKKKNVTEIDSNMDKAYKHPGSRFQSYFGRG